jgi:anti-sigma factor RsiW
MARRRRTTSCEQAGQLVSLRLDGELSDLEGAALDRHLSECSACRVLAYDLTGIAQLLRDAPLVRFERELALGGQRAGARLVGRAAAVASFAGAAAVAAVLVVSGTRESQAPPSAISFRSVAEQIRYVRVEQNRLEPQRREAVFTVSPRVAVRSL